jgi:hypothetical protein
MILIKKIIKPNSNRLLKNQIGGFYLPKWVHAQH